MAKAPLQTVKERWKDKAKLVAAVKSLMTEELALDRVDADKGLDSVSNRKLVRLHDVLAEVKSKFGSRAKLVDAIAAAQKRQKDADYKQGLLRHPTPRLLEIYRRSESK